MQNTFLQLHREFENTKSDVSSRKWDGQGKSQKRILKRIFMQTTMQEIRFINHQNISKCQWLKNPTELQANAAQSLAMFLLFVSGGLKGYFILFTFTSFYLLIHRIHITSKYGILKYLSIAKKEIALK